MWRSESQVMVVSAEYVARQVREVIKWRETWLEQEGLPMDTLMNETQKDAFLLASKQEYHSRPDQVELQTRDWETGKTRCGSENEGPMGAEPATTGWHHTDVAGPEFHGEIRPELLQKPS